MYDELKLAENDNISFFNDDDKLIKNVSHNQVLNCLLLLTKSNNLYIYDCNTRSFLTRISWLQQQQLDNGDLTSPTQLITSKNNSIKVINILDKCIILSDKTICSRTAYDGTLLLDSVFQLSTNSNLINIDQFKFEIEISLNDAYTLVNVIKSIEIELIHGLDEIISQLTNEIEKIREFKNDSWNTVRIYGTHSSLLSVFTQSIDELKRLNIQSLGIPILSSLLDRLYRLDVKYSISSFIQAQTTNFQNYDKRLMCSEANRRATFQDWPHMDYKWVLPDSLAQAGFYHQPSQIGVGDDRTICFVCNLCLVAWEQSDQPWSEHERHSPICHFVRGEITENIPLGLTTSTQVPLQVFKNENIVCTSDLSSDRYFAVSDLDGHIVVYETKDLLKEIMHVQLINDGDNKQNKLKIQSLCFYYRNHKHVLYGSFTINDDVFIFSFNIFDIYRSYQSRSNKKSSKSHKSSKSSTITAAKTSSSNNNNFDSTSKHHHHYQQQQPQESSIKEIQQKQDDLNNPIIKILETQLSDETQDELQQHKQNPDSTTTPPPEIVSSSSISTSTNKVSSKSSESSSKSLFLKQNSWLLPSSSSSASSTTTTTTAASSSTNTLNSLLFNAFNSITSNSTDNSLLFTKALEQQTAAAAAANALNNCNMCTSTSGFSFTNTTPAVFNPSQATTTTAGTSKRQPQITNLSNFLIVRFEVGANNDTTSKSKGKYKKSIKISVSAKVVSNSNSNDGADSNSNDILTIPLTQKAFEFTEKCLSFRLACIDLISDMQTRQNFNVKLINLYDKSLFAVVNFLIKPQKQKKEEEEEVAVNDDADDVLGHKLYQIKHEENNSSTTISKPQQTTELVVPTPPTVLSATSSSRLNLTELTINSLNTDCNILSLIAISVTTYEDDPDIRLIAMLDHNGLISIVDPFKNIKLCEFNSPSDQNEKFISISYCYGIDKICAISEHGRAYLICVRVSPIVNPINLNEIYSLIANNGVDDGSITLPKLVVDSNPLKSYIINSIHKLIYFEPTKLNFSAKFPPCWTQILAEQHQQRKHPQHVLAETVNHTKSWKYTNTSSSNSGSSSTAANLIHDDILIEIYLNKPIHIGCMQIKLKFNKELNIPYELRLYRQRKPTESSSSVDSKIDFNLSNKLDILFGPIDLRDYLDGNLKRTCVITICSNKLLDTTSNLYFLNLKAPRIDSNLDCSNLIDKIFITVRKYKKTGLPYERIERAVMLTKPVIFKRLLAKFLKSNENDQLNLLDIINWIFYNHLTQSTILNELKEEFLDNLEEFIQICYLNSNRSTSKKATLLLTFLLNPNIDNDKKISMQLLDNLIDKLNYLPYFETSASMYWFFMLLHQVMFLDMNKTYDKCLTMLTKLSKANKYNPYYALLKMRFNYTCLPFESKLFDADLYFKFDLNNQKIYQQQQQHQQQQQSHQQQQGPQLMQQQMAYQPFNLIPNNYTLYNQQQNLSTNPFSLFGFSGFTGFSGFSNLNSSNLISSNTAANNAGLVASISSNPFQFNIISNNGLNGNNSNNQSNPNHNGGGGGSMKQDFSSNESYNLIPQIVGLLEVLPLNFKCSPSSQGSTIEKTNSKQDLSIYMLPNCNTFLNSTNHLINQINQQPNNNDNQQQQQIIEDLIINNNEDDDELIEGITTDNPDFAKTTEPSTPKNTPFPGQTPPNEPATKQLPTVDTSIFNSIFSFQSLQLLVVERMEPASRHSVIIDFGFQVALTDIMIPACSELASLSIDIWSNKDQKDSRRLCVSTDINENPILLNDLQPAPVCRYLELIMLALSSNIIKAKIPIGFYFGYPYVFKNDTITSCGEETSSSHQQQQEKKLSLTSHLNYLEKLYEDCQCHYSMSIGKLCKLLSEIKFPNDNIGYIKMMQFSYHENIELTTKIKDSYNECLDYQFQLNLNRQMIKRINSLLNNYNNGENSRIKKSLKELVDSDINAYIEGLSQDQLRIINSLLVKTLLCLTSNINIQQLQQLKSSSPLSLNLDQASSLFHSLCINSNFEKECSWLLLRLSFNELWWGDFISTLLKNYFILQINEILPLNRIFIILNDICLKSLSYLSTNKFLFKSLFQLIISLLTPLESQNDSNLEITSLEWLLLFLSRLLSYVDKTRIFLSNNNNSTNTNSNDIKNGEMAANRWEFLENMYGNGSNSVGGVGGGKGATKLTNTLRNQYSSSQNQQQSQQQQQSSQQQQQASSSSYFNKNKAKKKLFQTNKYFLFNKIKETRKLNLYDLKYQRKMNDKGGSSNCYFSSNEKYLLNQLNEKSFSFIQLPRDLTLILSRLLIKLLINSNSYSNSDLFVLTCRILSSLCLNTEPAISLNEIISFDDLNKILLFCVGIEFNHGSASWGSPWSPHAVLCLLMDIIENEKYILLNEQPKPSSSTLVDNLSGDNKPQPPPPFDKCTSINSLIKQSTVNSNIISKNFSKLASFFHDLQTEDPQQTSTISSSTQQQYKQQLDYLFEHQQSINESSGNTNIKFIGQQNRKPITIVKSNNNNLNKLSTMSYDTRLDTSVSQTIENYLFIKSGYQIDSINRSICDPLPLILLQKQNLTNSDETSDTQAIVVEPEQEQSTLLIQLTIENLFNNLDQTNIENLLNFWLSLNLFDANDARFDLTKEPVIQLNEDLMINLIDYLVRYPFMTIKLWYLVYRTLTLALNQQNTQINLLNKLYCLKNLYNLIYKFMSITNLSTINLLNNTNQELCGDETCQAFIDFIRRFMFLNKSLNLNYNDYHMKSQLFDLLCNSIDIRQAAINNNDYINGCITFCQGSLDAQIYFIEFLIEDNITNFYEYNNQQRSEYDSQLIVKYFKNLSALIKYHLSVYPRLSLKGVNSPRTCFSSVLTSILPANNFNNYNSILKNIGSGDHHHQSSSNSGKQQNKQPVKLPQANQSILSNRDALVCLLLKLGVNILTHNIKNKQFNNNNGINKTNKSTVTKQANNTEAHLDSYYDDIFTQQMYLYELGLENEQLDSELDQYAMFDQQDEFDDLSIEENRYKDFVQQQQSSSSSISIPTIKQHQTTTAPLQQQQSELITSTDSKLNDTSIQLKLLTNITDECLELYVECLALCQSSPLAMVISNSGYPIDISLNDIQTPGDGLFLMLKTMANIVPLKLINASYNYLTKLKRLSEPLLWLLTHLFNNENQLKMFIDKGGLDVISKGLESTTRQLLYSGPCIISSLMNHIDMERQQAKMTNTIVDSDSTEGFTNFAPYSTIICTNQTANPVDVLIQSAVQNRRLRSAVWSYQFQPDEFKISLYLTFPYVFLLKEIHILPHTASFNNCPSYVSIEVSRDGAFMTPVGPPVHTIGMSTIKLQLSKSELVSVVQINLYKSKDSQIIGLSQIKLLGYPMFENMLSAKLDMMLIPIEDLVSRSNMGWLRLLYMCLTLVKNLDSYVCEKLTDNTISLCTNLLVSPAMMIYDKILETILIKLSKFNLKRNLEITKCLLNVEYGFNNGLYSVPHGMLMETIVNIFYQINEDSQNEHDRVKLILDWLFTFASKFNEAKANNELNRIQNHNKYKLPSNMLLHCVSCIIYNSQHVTVDSINEEYIKTIVQFSININEFYVKQAIDWIICSLLYQKPVLIHIIIDMIDLDELKRLSGKNETITIITNLIETLSYAIQSKTCIQLLVKSKFFEQFILYFINILNKFYSSSASASGGEEAKNENYLKIILNFMKIFISLADYSDGQEWLGSEQGSEIWKLLISLTCSSSSSSLSNQQQQSLDNNNASQRSEELCLLIIQLIKKMLFCNQNNQNLFSRYVTQLIKDLSQNCNNPNNNHLSSSNMTISGFLHQLILQIFLEDQTVTVNYVRKTDHFKAQCNSSLGLLTHPRYGTGNNNRTIELPLSKTCSQLLHLIIDIPPITTNNPQQPSQQFSSNTTATATTQPTQPLTQEQKLVNYILSDNMPEMSDLVSKLKPNYSEATSTKSNLKTNNNPNSAPTPKLRLFSKELSPDKYIPNDCTLANIVNAYLNKTNEKTVHYLTLFVKFITGQADEFEFKDIYSLNEQQEHALNTVTQTPLDAFVKCDGLVVLAERLPLVMPFIHEPLLNVTDKDRMASGVGGSNAAANDNPKTSSDFVEYVIMNESDEPFDDDIYGEIPLNTNQQINLNKIKKIAMPPHAFIAFGIFLKIPGYAAILLRNKRQAQCILKLLLGANRNKDDEFGISLSTMPFNSLRELLNDKKTASKYELAKFIAENRILTVILSILSTLSHHQHRQLNPHFINRILPDSSSDAAGNQEEQTTAAGTNQNTASTTAATTNNNANKGNSNLYWAKGTGFGTGSTIQQWDAERTLMQQKMEEEHVTCILQILSSYIKCFNDTDDMLASVIELFDHSCVITALSSYLRNDSVLDMSRHVPLYKASLELLQSFVRSKPLRELIEKCNLFDLLKNMKQLVDSYTSKIKLADEDGGLTCLNPVLQETFSLLSNVIKPIEKTVSSIQNSSIIPLSLLLIFFFFLKEPLKSDNSELSIEKFYCDLMKELQFDSFSIVSDSSGAIKANIPYYYESSLNELSNLNNANRAKRLAQETVTLSNSLPLSFSSSVFVRCDEERLDVMKVLITGPQDTPYSNGCFEFDVFFPSDYPDSPPLVNLQTTGNQTVRFNPNLYHDGKVCLSILNTWHGRPEERWNAQTSSFLQVLVSIQSLILVSEPYFNEPGYERSRGTPAGTASSIEHDANIRQATVKWGMLELIKKPSTCFKDIIQKHFYLKRKEVKHQCESWAKELELHVNDKQIGQSVLKSLTALKRHIAQLFEELDKLEAVENEKKLQKQNEDDVYDENKKDE